jgi:hypothetical protein
MPRLAAWLAAALALAHAIPAAAKEIGLHTPTRRQNYGVDESFGQALDQTSRSFVIEVATGLAPEGNLGLLLGVLNLPVRRLDLYLGFGYEANPAARYTASGRYTFTFGAVKPYVGLGYLLVDTHAIGVISHNVFAELGHRWLIHRTYHLSAGLGVRYLVALQVQDDSILNDPDIDRALLEEQLDKGLTRWVPMFALRFSRAF